MRYILISFFALFTFGFSQTYCAGDQISLDHQNIEHIVGAGIEDYPTGSIFKLADYNGDLNGGDYSIVFIDMSASWWGTCYSYGVPAVDALEETFSEYNVKFIAALEDPGQPYSCEQWQNGGVPGMPMVLDENQTSGSNFFSLLHDSWSAYPTFALIDHTMTVRAKPWTLESNSNTSSCDGSNDTIDGFSGGSVTDFIQQLLDECGSLCEGCTGTMDSDGDGIADECDDCNNMSGDINDDMNIDILDIVSVVNIILNGGINSSDYTECELSDANFNSDGSINVLDIIQIINVILDTSFIDYLDIQMN